MKSKTYKVILSTKKVEFYFLNFYFFCLGCFCQKFWIFLHHIFQFFIKHFVFIYTKNFAFFTPKILQFFTAKFLHFLTPIVLNSLKMFRPKLTSEKYTKIKVSKNSEFFQDNFILLIKLFHRVTDLLKKSLNQFFIFFIHLF